MEKILLLLCIHDFNSINITSVFFFVHIYLYNFLIYLYKSPVFFRYKHKHNLRRHRKLIFMVWLVFFRDIVLTMPFFNATLIVWWVPQHKFFKQKEVQKNEKDPVNACYGIRSRFQSCG